MAKELQQEMETATVNEACLARSALMKKRTKEQKFAVRKSNVKKAMRITTQRWKQRMREQAEGARCTQEGDHETEKQREKPRILEQPMEWQPAHCAMEQTADGLTQA